MKDETLTKVIRDLLLALRNMPQTYIWSDIQTKIDRDFKDEIDRILRMI